MELFCPKPRMHIAYMQEVPQPHKMTEGSMHANSKEPIKKISLSWPKFEMHTKTEDRGWECGWAAQSIGGRKHRCSFDVKGSSPGASWLLPPTPRALPDWSKRKGQRKITRSFWNKWSEVSFLMDSDFSGISFSAPKLDELTTHLESPYWSLQLEFGIRTFQRRACCQGRRISFWEDHWTSLLTWKNLLKNGELPWITGNSPDWTWTRRETCQDLANSSCRFLARTSSWVSLSGRAHGRTEFPGQDPDECGLCTRSTLSLRLSSYWATWSPSWSQAGLPHHSARWPSFSLLANYCALQKSCSWGLYQHRVDFTPIEDNDKVRKALARLLEDDFIGAAYIFDGKPGQSGLPEGSPWGDRGNDLDDELQPEHLPRGWYWVGHQSQGHLRCQGLPHHLRRVLRDPLPDQDHWHEPTHARGSSLEEGPPQGLRWTRLLGPWPETCQMTGLSDAMRANFGLLKDFSKHLHMPPAERVNAVSGFMKRFLGTETVSVYFNIFLYV